MFLMSSCMPTTTRPSTHWRSRKLATGGNSPPSAPPHTPPLTTRTPNGGRSWGPRSVVSADASQPMRSGWCFARRPASADGARTSATGAPAAVPGPSHACPWPARGTASTKGWPYVLGAMSVFSACGQSAPVPRGREGAGRLSCGRRLVRGGRVAGNGAVGRTKPVRVRRGGTGSAGLQVMSERCGWVGPLTLPLTRGVSRPPQSSCSTRFPHRRRLVPCLRRMATRVGPSWHSGRDGGPVRASCCARVGRRSVTGSSGVRPTLESTGRTGLVTWVDLGVRPRAPRSAPPGP